MVMAESIVKITWYGEDIKKLIGEATEEALFEGGLVLQQEAQSRAPVGRTGELKGSAYTATRGKSNYVKRSAVYRKQAKPPEGVAAVGFAAFYAKFVELGTSRLRARPFLRPALDEAGNRIAQAIAGAMGKELK